MEWVRDHPKRKLQNRAKHSTGSSWPTSQLKSNWYELFWRLSLVIHEMGDDRFKYGKGRAICQRRMSATAWVLVGKRSKQKRRCRNGQAVGQLGLASRTVAWSDSNQ